MSSGEAAHGHPALTSMGTWCLPGQTRLAVFGHCGILGSTTSLCETSCRLLTLSQEDLPQVFESCTGISVLAAIAVFRMSAIVFALRICCFKIMLFQQ